MTTLAIKLSSIDELTFKKQQNINRNTTNVSSFMWSQIKDNLLNTDACRQFNVEDLEFFLIFCL